MIIFNQGVLADYKANKALKQAERDAKEQQRKDILRRMVEGAKVVHTGETVSAINNELDDDDDDDDEFLAEYRKKRLQGFCALSSKVYCVIYISFRIETRFQPSYIWSSSRNNRV